MILTIEIVIFWVAVALMFHSYVFFPMLINILARRKESNTNVYEPSDNSLPFVSIVIAAYNEEKVIAQRIHDIMLTDYPVEKLEILVGSDASSDKTNEILNELSQQYPQLKVYVFEQRTGKGNILNSLVQKVNGEFCLFTDANISFMKDTIYHLIKHFKNPDIGLVGGNIRSSEVRNDGISRQENSFISNEMRIKHNEGKLWGTMIGAYGACYMMRTSLYVEIPQAFIVDDFFVSMKVIEKNKLSILEMNAICFEHIPNLLEEEFRRKVRISTGNFQNMHVLRNLLFQFTPLSFCYLSHKVIRWIGPFLLCIAFMINLLLYHISPFFMITMCLQGILILIPLIDYFLRKIHIHIIILRFITHFYSMNFALIVGFCKYLKGVKTNVWKPTTREY